MLSRFAISVAVILVVFSSFTLAQTTIVVPDGYKFHQQDFAIGALNSLLLGGAGGTVTSQNLATVIQNQSDWKPCSEAVQDELVVFVQDAVVTGQCGGTWAVGQDALVAGAQMQLVGDGCNPKIQSQNLGVGLGQIVTKLDGSGSANAAQNVASVQNQMASNSAGTMTENNVVVAGQMSQVVGGPCTSGEAVAGLTVGTSQYQADL